MATIARTQVAPRALAQRLTAPRVAGYLLILPAVIYVLALVGFPLIIGVVATVAKITLSVALAFLMLGAFPGRGILRTLFVLPWTIPIALSTIAYKWMFHSQYSVITWILSHLGFTNQPIQWLGAMPAAMIAVIFVSTRRAG